MGIDCRPLRPLAHARNFNRVSWLRRGRFSHYRSKWGGGQSQSRSQKLVTARTQTIMRVHRFLPTCARRCCSVISQHFSGLQSPQSSILSDKWGDEPSYAIVGRRREQIGKLRFSMYSTNAMAVEVLKCIGRHDGNFVLSSNGREYIYRMMICSDLDATRMIKTIGKARNTKNRFEPFQHR